MQYVKCRFRPTDSRTYTYTWDGDPLQPGEMVKVEDSRNPGSWKRVEVVETSDIAPSFACKPILGRVDDGTADDGDFLKEMTK